MQDNSELANKYFYFVCNKESRCWDFCARMWEAEQSLENNCLTKVQMMEWKLFQQELGGLREGQNEITGSWNHLCKPLGAARTVRAKTRWPRAGTCHGAVGVPTGLGVRGNLETFQLISWLHWRQWEYCHCFRWSTLVLLHNVEQLNLNLKYLNIRYSIWKSVPSFKTGGEAEQDMEKQNKKVRLRGVALKTRLGWWCHSQVEGIFYLQRLKLKPLENYSI